jgi:hypothetical protein
MTLANINRERELKAIEKSGLGTRKDWSSGYGPVLTATSVFGPNWPDSPPCLCYAINTPATPNVEQRLVVAKYAIQP